MTRRHIIILFISLFAFFELNNCYAGDSTTHKYPRVVLVQLSSEQNRIEALTKANGYTDADEVKMDAKRTASVTINDFRDHFDYCPVYYFFDINAEAIKNKQFEGILLNADGSKAINLPVNNKSTDYYIVYYGYPNIQMGKDRVASDQLSSDPGRGLIVLNDEYKQIAYSIDPDYVELNYLFKKRKLKYAYFSKHYNIQYIPYAEDLDTQLREGKGTFRGHLGKKNRKQ